MTTEAISVLFVTDTHGAGTADPFEKAEGFRVRYAENRDQCLETVKTFHPDIVLVDPGSDAAMDRARTWIRQLADVPFTFTPGFFLVTEASVTMDDKCRFRSWGYDEVILRPVQTRKIRYLSHAYLRHNILEQRICGNTRTIHQARIYLDRFKQHLFSVKKELSSEKTSLNNALKQIHHMTRERSHLKTRIQALKQARKQDMDGYEKLLAQLIQNRVENSRGHGERVAHIACYVGKSLGFDEKKLENLHKAGMLHEIGLVFMPRTPAASFDQLTAFEKSIQAQYPVKGADLLSLCTAFEKPAQIIRHLHENVDGSGYPRGWKKAYIPMPSRVLAGADLFDGLRNREDICCLEDLMAGLEHAAGSRLDPLVVSRLQKYALEHMASDTFQVRGVGVGELEPGMRLGSAVFTATGTKLFSADTVLTKTAIDRIIQYNREYPVDDILYIKV